MTRCLYNNSKITRYLDIVNDQIMLINAINGVTNVIVHVSFFPLSLWIPSSRDDNDDGEKYSFSLKSNNGVDGYEM